MHCFRARQSGAKSIGRRHESAECRVCRTYQQIELDLEGKNSLNSIVQIAWLIILSWLWSCSLDCVIRILSQNSDALRKWVPSKPANLPFPQAKQNFEGWDRERLMRLIGTGRNYNETTWDGLPICPTRRIYPSIFTPKEFDARKGFHYCADIIGHIR